MFRIYAPVILVPTAEARQAIGRFLRQAGQAAYREIAMAAKGLEIAHLQFAFRELTLAVCSRIRRDGMVEIELGLGNPRLPAARSPRDSSGRPNPLPTPGAVVPEAGRGKTRTEAPGAFVVRGTWSGRGESNPRVQLGRLPFYH